MKTSFLRKISAIVFLCLFSTFLWAQILHTSLRVTVRNELGNLEEEAVVQIFLTDEDLRNGTNKVAEEKTDNKGRAIFRNLESVVYYVNVEKGDKNNYGGGQVTTKLTAKKLNNVTIIIE
jgi:hypothetical protein